MGRNSKSVLWSSAAVLSALAVTALCGVPAAAQQKASHPQVLNNAVASEPAEFDVSAPLSEMAKVVSEASPRVTVRPMLQPKLTKLETSTPGPSAVPRYPGPG